MEWLLNFDQKAYHSSQHFLDLFLSVNIHWTELNEELTFHTLPPALTRPQLASDWSDVTNTGFSLVNTLKPLRPEEWQTAEESWSLGWHLNHFKPSASHIPSLFTRGQKSHSSLIEVVKNPDLSDLYHFILIPALAEENGMWWYKAPLYNICIEVDNI